jgi:DNA-binding NarL/FixJ family response regulator
VPLWCPAVPGDTIDVVVVEDHEFVAFALQKVLEAQPATRVLATTGDPDRALALLDSNPVDVVVLDLRLARGLDATTLIPTFLERSPTTKVLVLSAWSDDRSVTRAVEAGCHGYVLKDQAPAELVRAVMSVANGEVVFAPSVMPHVLRLLRPSAPAGETLTARETEVLQLLAEGLPTDEMAARLYLSVNTVRNHVHSVLRKLGVHSRLEAVAHGIRRGLITVG